MIQTRTITEDNPDKLALAENMSSSLYNTAMMLSYVCMLQGIDIVTRPFNLQDNIHSGIFVVCASAQILIAIVSTFDFVFQIRFKQYKRSKKYLLIYDFLSGPLSLTLNLISLSIFGRIWLVTVFIQSFQLLTLDFSRKILWDNLKFIQANKNLLITSVLIFFFLSYAGVYILYFEDKFFSNFPSAALTLWKWITLDNWSDDSQQILMSVGSYSLIYIWFSIFLINFFYMNLMGGIMIDVQKNKVQTRNLNYMLEEYGINFVPCVDMELFELEEDEIVIDSVPMTVSDQILVGRVYQYIVMAITYFTLFGLLVTNTSDLRTINSPGNITINLINVTLYTIHLFIVVSIKPTPYIMFERDSQIMMITHILSGPVALGVMGFEIYTYEYISYGSFFSFLKVFTTPRVKGILRGTFHIFQTTWFLFLMLTQVIIMTSCFCQICFKTDKYFSRYTESIITSISVVTMDNWNSVVLSHYANDPRYVPLVLYMLCLIYLSNFVLMNIIVSLCCEYFQIYAPMQKNVMKTLEFSAKKEYKSIIMILTQLGITIPFLEDNDGQDIIQMYSLHFVIESNTDTELQIAENIVRLQDAMGSTSSQYSSRGSKGGRRNSLLLSIVTMMKSEGSQKKRVHERKLVEENIHLSYRGKTVKVWGEGQKPTTNSTINTSI